MFRKIFITIITTFIMVVTGSKGMHNLKTDNIVEDENIVKEANVEIPDNNTIDNEVDESRDEDNSNMEVDVLERNDNNNSKISNEPKVVIKNGESNVETKQYTKVENKDTKEVSNNTMQTTQTQKKEETIKQESNVESTKESINYNASESQRMVNDINSIARENEFLWDSNGNPLFKVEISKSAMNGEYMYPYSKQRLEGKVLNVFPVKFLVYVVDVQRPGFQKEMKYYISIVNL